MAMLAEGPFWQCKAQEQERGYARLIIGVEAPFGRLREGRIAA